MTPPDSDTGPSGLALVYQDMRAELTRFLTARLGDAGEAEEAVQELYLRLHGAGQGGPVGNARAYLYRAAQNVALDRVRERRRRRARDDAWADLSYDRGAGGEPIDGNADAEAALVENERVAALSAAIDALPAGARRVFMLHKIDGVPHAAIAGELGISRSGVEKHLSLAMAHLRRALADK